MFLYVGDGYQKMTLRGGDSCVCPVVVPWVVFLFSLYLSYLKIGQSFVFRIWVSLYTTENIDTEHQNHRNSQ